MKYLLTISLILLTLVQVKAQVRSNSFDELDSLQSVESRDIMVFLRTDWCKYCKTMERSVFSQKELGQRINDNFWFVAFDGESQSPITFMAKQYEFKPTGLETGIHELAEAIGTIDGQVSFPSLVVIKQSGEVVFQFSGFLNKKRMVVLLDQLIEAGKL